MSLTRSMQISMPDNPDVYIVHRAETRPDLSIWNSATWGRAQTLRLANVFSRSSDHLPDTRVRLLYNDEGIYGIFKVEDRYVRAVNCGNQASVCLDSCVEFFVRPAGGTGYLNFEMNCGGSLLCYHVRDYRRTPDGFADFTKLSNAQLDRVKRHACLPVRVEPEITEPTTWTMGFFIPAGLFESVYSHMAGMPWTGQSWHANFYKCADQTSHPHWISWRPIPELNFHRPDCFGELRFA